MQSCKTFPPRRSPTCGQENVLLEDASTECRQKPSLLQSQRLLPTRPHMCSKESGGGTSSHVRRVVPGTLPPFLGKILVGDGSLVQSPPQTLYKP